MRHHVPVCGCGTDPLHAAEQHAFVMATYAHEAKQDREAAVAAVEAIVAEYQEHAKRVGVCRACGQLQDTPSCRDREHWLPAEGS